MLIRTVCRKATSELLLSYFVDNQYFIVSGNSHYVIVTKLFPNCEAQPKESNHPDFRGGHGLKRESLNVGR